MFVSVLLLHYFISMCVVVFRDVWNRFFISDWFRFSFFKKKSDLVWNEFCSVRFKKCGSDDFDITDITHKKDNK